MPNQVVIASTSTTAHGTNSPRFTCEIRFKRLVAGTDFGETEEVLPHPKVQARSPAHAHAMARDLAQRMLDDGRAAAMFS